MDLSIYKPKIAMRRSSRAGNEEKIITLTEAEKLAEDNEFIRAFLADDDIDECSMMSSQQGFAIALYKQFEPQHIKKVAISLIERLFEENTDPSGSDIAGAFGAMMERGTADKASTDIADSLESLLDGLEQAPDVTEPEKDGDTLND